MRFKVPQNIDIEDRILGPLTLVQFVYGVIGFGLCYIILNTMSAPLSYLLMTPIALFVICLDFVKINERPFLQFFFSAIEFYSSPKQRFWHQGDDTDFTVEIYHITKEKKEVSHKYLTHDQIARLAQNLDTAEADKTLIRK